MPLTNNKKSISIFLGFGILIMLWVYIPGIKLFFRNDDWNFFVVMNNNMNNIKEQLINFILYGSYYGNTLRHFMPINNGLYLFKFYFFGNVFPLHYGFSLILHIINVVLVYIAGMKISSNRVASFIGTILFGFSAIYADTVFWPLLVSYILLITVTLLSIIFHPALRMANQKFTRISNILFYITTAIAPLVYEPGIITIIIAIFLFVSKGKFKIRQITILTLFLLMYFISRIIVVNIKSLNHSIFFCGVRSLIFNMFIAPLKLLLGIFGGIFKIEVTDTLYILAPDFKNPITLIAIAIILIVLFYVLKFIKDPDVSKSLKVNCLILFIMAMVPFIMFSSSCDPTNSDPDLVHQMPRYFYFSIVLATISLTQAIFYKRKIIFSIILSIFVIYSGIFSTLRYFKSIKPHTDKMKEAVVVFKHTLNLPYKGPHPGLGLSKPWLLDWTFDEVSVNAYLHIPSKSIFNYSRLLKENFSFDKENLLKNIPDMWQMNSIEVSYDINEKIGNKIICISLKSLNSSGYLEYAISDYKKYRGKILTLWALAKRHNACSTYISLDDGVSVSNSKLSNVTLEYFDFLSVTKKIDNNAKHLKVKLVLDAINSEVSFYDVILIER